MNSSTVAHNHAKKKAIECSGEKVQEDAEERETPMEIEAQEAAAPPRKTEAAPNSAVATKFQQYLLHGLIDKGTFSTVSLATLLCEQHLPPDAKRRFAIKHITPTSHPARIEREMMCMMKIGGQCNVVGLVNGFRHQGSVALVMEYIPQEPFHLYYARLTPAEVQRYLQQLLIALERVHLYGVIHRDVKPSNFLHSPRNGTYVLVDFGLAQETEKGVLSLRTPDDSRKKREEQPKCGTVVPVRNPLKRQAGASKPDSASNVAGVQKCPRRMSIVQENRCLKESKSGNSSSISAVSGSTRHSASQPTCNCYGQAKVCNRCLVRPEMNAPRAGTPGYRPPEVLLKYPHQTTAVDIWAAGVIFLSLLSKCYPFFDNVDDQTSLAHMIEVFGYERLRETARALDVNLLCDPETMTKRPYSFRRICQHFREICRRREMGTEAGGGVGAAEAAGGSSPPSGRDDEQQLFVCDNCCKPANACLCQRRWDGGGMVNDDSEPAGDKECDEYGPDAYELLERLLETNPHRRITASEALKHPYFQVQY